MKVMVSGGGTGGHVYPALTVVQKLNQLQFAESGQSAQILWVGSVGGMEQNLVKQAGLKIKSISAAGLRGKNPVAALKGFMALSRGYSQSQRLIRHFQPDILFVTGGYVCVPVTLAARRVGIPVIIYLPDLEPGLAIKFLARFAKRVAVTTPEVCRHFKSDLTVVTGYPLRAALQNGPPDEADKVAARQQLGLSDKVPTLLVFGGSQGARSINQAFTAQLMTYLKFCQVIHISGKLDVDWVQSLRAELPQELQARYHVAAYLHQDMATALAAADLVISRAGAAVLGEYPAIGLPSILVPLPIAGGHQWLNANYLAAHHAAIVIDNADLHQKLKDIALDLITDKQRLQAMSKASQSLAKPDATLCLAQVIMEVKNNGS